MTGIFNTFNTAKLGMYAQQNAIATTSHNIANANTQGYSRQRVHLQTNPAYSLGGVGMVGTGVDVAHITRIRDNYLDTQIRYEEGIAGEYKARQEVLGQVEMIFMEPSDTGLNTLMGRMWDSWQELAKSPENSNASTIVRDNALSFTDNLNHMYEQLETLKNDNINLLEKKALDAHSILEQVGSLNSQISKVMIKNQIPNDLMDQRDVLLDQLSQIVDFTTTEDKHGRITIESNDVTLLEGTKDSIVSQEISIVRSLAQDADGNVTITLVRGGDSIDGLTRFTVSQEEYNASFSSLKEGSVLQTDKAWDPNGGDFSPENISTFDISHGELKGYQSVIEEVGKYQDQLDGLARAVAHTLNTIHMDNGATEPVAFFVGQGNDYNLENISAKNITINRDIQEDVRLINAGKSFDSPDGDGQRALAISQLRNARLPVQDFIDNYQSAVQDMEGHYNSEEMSFENMTGGTTLDAYYKDIVAELGISAQQAHRMVDNQNALTAQLTQRRDSISGVSMDEEVANLVQFQHAYQANSRVISTLTAMLDTLINRMGA